MPNRCRCSLDCRRQHCSLSTQTPCNKTICSRWRLTGFVQEKLAPSFPTGLGWRYQMQGMTRRRLCKAALGLLPIASVVWAQQTPPLRLRGTIAAFDGNVLTVKPVSGGDAKLALSENALIVAVVKASLAEVKQGTFLGSAAIPQPDGTQKAVEVHIFPEEMRGTGEGHRPYAPVANGTMTNGTASGATVSGVEGSTITVRYNGGEKKIVVPPDAPVLRYEIGNRADLKPGAHFTVAATKKPDGTFDTSRINVGRDGAVPQ